MIKIPFDRCVILTTLDFEQISERLATAIYDPRMSPIREHNHSSKQQYYHGRINGFKFSANRIIGHKSFHLPLFLSPTIEGNIKALSTGYEISLAAKLQNLTFVLLLTWLGGLLTACAISLEKILVGIQDDRYATILAGSVVIYLIAIAYIYLSSWLTTRFFKTLFTQGLTGITKIQAPQYQTWHADLQQIGERLRS